MLKEHIARLICLLHQTVQLMCYLSWTVSASSLSSQHAIPRAMSHSASIPQKAADQSQPQSALIFDANHHYSNYNYPNSHHPPTWLYSHSNEVSSSSGYGWTSGHMNNLTASVGRNATFECVFPDLKKDFRLVWFHRTTVLALQDMVVAKNGRVSVRSHANTTFYLTVHDIREEDRGNYMCQVNTVPMRSQIGHLEVNVPPTFLEQFTSSDVDIREESPVSLRCSAKGRPIPEISWRREDGNAINLERHNKSSADKPIFDVKGPYLNISKTSRTDSGAYLCIASNGIPSPISKRIFLGVSFAPVIWSSKQSIGIYVGSTVVLECNLESYPRPSVYWRKDDQMPPIIHSNLKHEIALLETNTSYRFVLRLKIVDVHKSDMGKYTCVAKNMLSEVKTSMQVYEIEQRTIQTHKINTNSRTKSVLVDMATTRNPTRREPEQKQVARKVTDNFSLNQENGKTEVFGYEPNFISPEMGNEPSKENKATSHLLGWPILLSSSVILLQRVFAFAR